jgi:hypothetical protein
VDRSHSMLRIATTASPISGADIRERIEMLRLVASVNQAVATIQKGWAHYHKNGGGERKNKLDASFRTASEESLFELSEYSQMAKA